MSTMECCMCHKIADSRSLRGCSCCCAMIVWNETAAYAAIAPQMVAKTDLRGLPKNTSARSPIGARARFTYNFPKSRSRFSVAMRPIFSVAPAVEAAQCEPSTTLSN